MAVPARVRFKASDVWDVPDDSYRYEVIDGELYMTPAPSWEHQRVLNRLDVRVSEFVYKHRLGEVVLAPVAVVLDNETAVQPDLVYISRERLGIVSQRGVEGPPDLVEVLSPTTEARDRGLKMRRYAATGIPHDWIVDPRARVLERYRLGSQGYERTGRHGPGSVFEPALFAGLQIAGDEL